jgi:hypothetical protein
MNFDDLLATNSFLSNDDETANIDYIDDFRRYNQNTNQYRDKSFDMINKDRVSDIIDEQRPPKIKKRYTKHILSAISIDSRDRDISKYFKPNQYEVFFNREYENIVKIELLGIEMPNPTQPVNIQNNKIKWICRERLDFISDFNLQTGIEKYKDANFETVTTEYETTIPPGFYSTDGLAKKLRERMNEIPDLNSKPQFFYVDINTEQHVTTFVNRFEELKIASISMVKNTTILIITPADFDNIDESWTDLNIVLTDIPSISGIPATIYNIKEYTNVTFVSGSLHIDIGIFAVYNEVLSNLDITNARFGKSRYFSFKHLGVGNADDTTSDGVINTILWVLGFPVPKGNLTVVSQELPARPIHKNIHYLYEDYIRLATVAGQDVEFFDTSVHILNIELGGDGKHYFRSEPYIFLRLAIPKGKTGEVGGNITPSLSNSGSVERRNLYYQNPLQSTLKTEDSKLLKNVNNIFAKINLNVIPGNMLYHTFTKSIKIFYEAPLRRFGRMIVEFVDSKGKLMDLRNEHSFTIEITEEIDVLEDSLINSRSGDFSRTGLYMERESQ